MGTALRELSISDCLQVTDFGMYELARLGSNLRYLSVAKCDQISDAGIKHIGRHCYKLRYLNLRGCEAVSDDSLEVLAQLLPAQGPRSRQVRHHRSRTSPPRRTLSQSEKVEREK